MEKWRHIFFSTALAVALCVAAFPSFASDTEDGPMVSFPAFPAQLPPGAKPGTFQFSQPVAIKFSQKSEFPVDYVVEDYAHKEVFRTSIKSGTPVCITCDLSPGSYKVIYKMTGKAKNDYWDESGSPIFINAEGKRGYISGSSINYPSTSAGKNYWRPDPIIRKKIKPIEPAPQATVTGKQILFRWESIPGVDTYTVTVWPIQHPNHPDSGYSAEIKSALAKGSHLTVPLGPGTNAFDLESEGVYTWTVRDGGDQENVSSGRIARSSASVLFTAGAKEHFQTKSSDNYMRDEMIESRLGIRLLQPYQPSDGSPVYLTIVAVGSRTPALKAGLVPGDRIATFDGKPVGTLNQFHDFLAAAPSGKTVIIETVYDEPKAYKTLKRPYSVVLP
jgi:hypothetical protein